MCLHKTSLPDGRTSECQCPRYIPQDDPQPGPRVCRDCEHWESYHPLPDAPKAKGIADLMAHLKPQVDKVRHSGLSLEDEARKESNAGFKKVSEESSGRGGSTKYIKKNKSGATRKPVDKSHLLGDIVLIPDAVWGDPDASDAADDIKEIGVGPVPNVVKQQQLKDGGLVISDNGRGGYLEFRESWSAEHIEQKWVKPLIPNVYGYFESTHELEEGEIMLIPLVADHGRLKVFKKKGPITGSDLETIKSGKGKRPDSELTTIYFALRFNVPSKIWSNNRWDDPLSDTDFQEKPKSKGKAKAKATQPQPRPKPKPLYGTRSSSKTLPCLTPVKVKTEPGVQGPSPFTVTGKGKIAERKHETESKPSDLFLEIDSDSDVDFPTFLLGPTFSARSTASAIPSTSGTTSDSSTSIGATLGSSTAAASSNSSGPSLAVPALPAFNSGTSIGATSGTVPAVPANSVTVPSSTSSSAPVPSTSSTTAAPPNSPFGLPSILQPTTRASRYFGSGSASTSRASSSSAPSYAHRSSSQRTGADYAAETAAMEAFNEFGNYREASPKRTFDTAFLESSGFQSPERPSNNPWKRLRKIQQSLIFIPYTLWLCGVLDDNSLRRLGSDAKEELASEQESL
ncbi:hypothetical protein C8R45DRAFT_1084172 [Mycena sanguinolenta]|nr:hypothetical protein C8R45DRAFT_1084172 [Mycena sanguinolenta]